MNDKCRVSIDEAAHDRATSFNSDAEERDYGKKIEQELTDKVNEVMGGGNPDLVMECIANDDDIAKALLELATLDCSKSIDEMTVSQARYLQSCAHDVNAKIAEKLRGWV